MLIILDREAVTSAIKSNFSNGLNHRSLQFRLTLWIGLNAVGISYTLTIWRCYIYSIKWCFVVPQKLKKYLYLKAKSMSEQKKHFFYVFANLNFLWREPSLRPQASYLKKESISNLVKYRSKLFINNFTIKLLKLYALNFQKYVCVRCIIFILCSFDGMISF